MSLAFLFYLYNIQQRNMPGKTFIYTALLIKNNSFATYTKNVGLKVFVSFSIHKKIVRNEFFGSPNTTDALSTSEL